MTQALPLRCVRTDAGIELSTQFKREGPDNRAKERDWKCTA